MFYQKTLRDLRAANESLCKSWEKKASELSAVQEAYARLLAKNEEYAGDLLKKDDEISALVRELSEADTTLGNLRTEAEDTSRMLELYRALVSSLRIAIKLPARKK